MTKCTRCGTYPIEIACTDQNGNTTTHRICHCTSTATAARCRWREIDTGWDSTCGYATGVPAHGWEYCPFCGRKIEVHYQ